MHQRDFILRIIEQLGAALIELRKRLLGGSASNEEIAESLAALSGQAGFDIVLLRSFTIDSLYMFAAPGGEVEPSRCWLMAECLYVDGLQASMENRSAEAWSSLTKARALYDLVRPGGAMLVGFPEAVDRIDAIDAALSDLPEARPRHRRAGRRRSPRVRPPQPLAWHNVGGGLVAASAALGVILLQACVPAQTLDTSLASVDPYTAQLIDCTGFQPTEPADSRGFIDVTVPVVVGPDGRVEDVGAPRAPRERSTREELDRAVSLARSCTFTPATIDDLPVRSRATVQLRIARAGGA